jgi:hypothetical protein
MRRPQARYWWAVRVTVSIGLLAFGIASQTLPLERALDPATRRRHASAGGDAVPVF